MREACRRGSILGLVFFVGFVGGVGCFFVRLFFTYGRTVVGGVGDFGSVGRVRGSVDGCGRLLWVRG